MFFMDVEYFREYCLSKKGVEECFPFDESTLVFKVMKKMFALCGLEKHPPAINLKCDPERSEILRDQFPGSIMHGYHMDKKHWNTVYIESELDDKLIKELIDHSYDLIIKSLPKKVQIEWQNIP